MPINKFEYKQTVNKKFTGYTRSIINLHKWHISPPEYLMIDLKCDGSPKSRTQGQAYLIIYGIEGRFFFFSKTLLRFKSKHATVNKRDNRKDQIFARVNAKRSTEQTLQTPTKKCHSESNIKTYKSLYVFFL